MLRDLTSLLRDYRESESEVDYQLSGTDSEDDDEIEHLTTTEESQRFPPIITWKLVCPVSQTQHALSDSLFGNLPTEILLQIFRWLAVRDLGNISLVCRYFKVIADQDDTWKSKCNPSNELQSTSFKQIYMDWIYGKYLRRRELKKVTNRYRKTSKYIPCLLNTCCSSSEYSRGAKGKDHALPGSGFVEHPNSSLDMTIELSVDLDRTVIALMALLEKASEFIANCWGSTIVQQMLMRYYRFMQLNASYPNERLVPTLDIEIVWQTHLLRPEMYRGDCLRLFRRIIDHSLLIDSVGESLKEKAFANTCRLYEERFGEQYCPLVVNEEENTSWSAYRHSLLDYIQCPIPAYSYWDKTSFNFAAELPDDYKNPFSFVEADVILDRYWFNLYCTDMYGVGMKIMSYDSQAQQTALRSAMKRLRKSYERFLYVAAKYSPMNGYDFVHPTCAIDIVWHSHMQEPLKYAGDCNRLIGFVIDHVPWSSTKTADQILESSVKMNELWKAEFDRDIKTDHLE